MQRYTEVPKSKTCRVTIGTERDVDVARIVDAAISFYLEEGLHRDENGKKIDFTLEVEEEESNEWR